MKQAVFNKTAFIPVEIDMSVLTVSNVTHGFGARQILDDASFRLLKGEHVGLIGANGEGKSTFLNIITGKIPPDEGKIEWSNCRLFGSTCGPRKGHDHSRRIATSF